MNTMSYQCFLQKRRNRNVKILLQSESLLNSSWKSSNSLPSLLLSSWSSVAWTSSTTLTVFLTDIIWFGWETFFHLFDVIYISTACSIMASFSSLFQNGLFPSTIRLSFKALWAINKHLSKRMLVTVLNVLSTWEF